MVKYVISREKCGDERGSFIKPVAQFDSLQEAMDALYRGARRYGFSVAVDNSADPSWGFCLWQIYVQVGCWRYKVTQEDDCDLFGLL